MIKQYVRDLSVTSGITILGRSDAALKPSEVHIGTAEIYSVIEKLPEIADSLAVGQYWRATSDSYSLLNLRRLYFNRRVER